jgi:hypothetical protein
MGELKKKKKHYPTSVMWWNRLIKRRIKLQFITEGAERRRDRKQMESFYYEEINSILRDNTTGTQTTTKLKELKAKIVRLHGIEQQKRLLDIGEQDRLTTEIPSIFHLTRTKKRQEMRNTQRITDRHENIREDTINILRTFTEHLKEKYEALHVNTDEVEMMGHSIPTQVSHEANIALEGLISMDELKEAIRSGKNLKAPGSDGISQEFYKAQWNTIKHEMLEILRQMHNDGEITPQQNMGYWYASQKRPRRQDRTNTGP